MLKRILQAAALLAGLSAGIAHAADEEQRYDVYAGGLKLGTMGMNANLANDRYAVNARVAGGGLLGALIKFDFAGRSEGRIAADGTLQPASYSGTSDDGKRERTVKFTYGSKTPRNVSFSPARTPRDYDAAPSAQSGTLDPISATLSLLRPMPVGEACGKRVEVFDGSKRSRLSVAARQPARDGLFVCNGTYSRISGFSPKLMAKQVNFPFSIFWRETNGMMEVVRFQTDTTFGTVSAIRR
ncbi:DUF3108 domain-containing protein [Algicella marina]|nr:DUF3108 domain-containing protein [Algicella marina]